MFLFKSSGSNYTVLIIFLFPFFRNNTSSFITWFWSTFSADRINVRVFTFNPLPRLYPSTIRDQPSCFQPFSLGEYFIFSNYLFFSRAGRKIVLGIYGTICHEEVYFAVFNPDLNLLQSEHCLKQLLV